MTEKDTQNLMKDKYDINSRFSGEHLSSFSPETRTAINAVLHAAEAIEQIDIAGTEQEKTGRINDFVTAWDKVGQDVIEKELLSKFPQDKILGEESDQLIQNPAQQERLWVIDPIDGTANARDGRRFSFISLGCTQNGESTAGIVYDPYHHDLYYAEKGKGAFKNGKPIHVSTDILPEKGRINTDMGFIAEVSDLHGDMLKAHGSPTRRMMGSSIGGMIEVASGKADIFFYTAIKPWDNAAAFVILKEAGADIRGVDGREINFTSMDVVVGNKSLVDDFVARVGKPHSEQVKSVQQIFLQKNPELSGVVSGI